MFYTRKGDSGTTKLFGCTERIPKSNPRVDTLGTIDELNSWLGYCAALSLENDDAHIARVLREIQNDLFVIQALLAGAPKFLSAERLQFLEQVIAEVAAEIPPIRTFTIPGATVLGGALDVGRTIARRAERSLVCLNDTALSHNLVPYLNRLSSVLFAFARLAAHRAHTKELAPTYERGFRADGGT